MLAPAYVPRSPEGTVLYGLVRQHLETFLRFTAETYEKPLPPYVEREFRDYLDCGIFARGFVRCHCDHCGYDLLVAFSCKRRGLCPSWCTRRMSNEAAHLVDRVVPDVPVRQYVLSLPFELRRLVAFRADVLASVSRILSECVLARTRKACAIKRAEGGAVVFVQHFGGSINLNVHFHLVALDGGFERGDGELLFHRAAAPSREELARIVDDTEKKLVRWLKRKKLLADDGESHGACDEPSALEGCAALAMSRGTFAARRDQAPKGEDAEATFEKRTQSADRGGFSLHAGVRIEAGDDVGRERLFRYGARPALSLERLSVLPDGRIAYRVKYPRSRAASHRVMTPMEFMARLAALIPPPRYPLVRYAGVLAPNSKWRKLVVPKPRKPLCEHEPTVSPRGQCVGKQGDDGNRNKTLDLPTKTDLPPVASALGPLRPDAAGAGPNAAEPRGAIDPPIFAPRPTNDAPGARQLSGPVPEVIRLGPNVVSVKHWERLLEGALLATSPRVDWARLLRRGLDVDALECPKCKGRLRVMAVITEQDTAKAICEHLGLPTRAPPPARSRSPGDDDVQLAMAW